MIDKRYILLIGCLYILILNHTALNAYDFEDKMQHMQNRINEIESYIGEDSGAIKYRERKSTKTSFAKEREDIFIKKIKTIGFAGMSDGEFLSPKGMALIDNNLYVADSDNSRIQILTQEGRYISYFDSISNSGIETFRKPIDITYANSKIYVVDKKLDKVFVYRKNGDFVNSFGNFTSPRSIDSDSYGNLYICDVGKKAIYIYNKSGRQIRKINNIDKANKMYMPIDVEVTNDNQIYVLDKSRRSIIKYDSNYNFVQETKISDYTKWVRSLSIDDAGHVYVVTDDPSIVVFDSKLNFLGKIRNNIYKPDSILVKKNKMFVSDFRKHSIYIYEVYM